LGSSASSSVDQCPHTIVWRAVRLVACMNHGRMPAGACSRPRFSRKSMRSSAVQKRSRVHTLTIARRRSSPSSSSRHVDGSSP
jgi:hypothetical protein